MKTSKNGFTMIELVFVIVVLGILASVAIPKLSATRVDAQISKARSNVAAIRSGIVTERQSGLIKGESDWITDAALDGGNGDYFGGVLTYGVTASTSDGWSGTAGSGAYTYTVGGVGVGFTYDDSTGIFTCDKTAGSAKAQEYCSKITD